MSLVFSACIGTRSQATKAERALKLRPKRLKEDLVKGLVSIDQFIPNETAALATKTGVSDDSA